MSECRTVGSLLGCHTLSPWEREEVRATVAGPAYGAKNRISALTLALSQRERGSNQYQLNGT